MHLFSFTPRLASAGLILGLLSTALLGACGKDNDDDDPGAGDGTVTWTHNGQTYTSTLYSSAIIDSDTSLLVTGSSADMQNTVSLRLKRIYRTGAGVYDLKRGSMLNNYSVGGLTLGSSAQYLTLYGPSPSNGTVTVSQYDRNAQKVSGSFSFTGGALPNSAASGTQNVTNGSFTFTRFR
jgi:hypothetical protein